MQLFDRFCYHSKVPRIFLNTPALSGYVASRRRDTPFSPNEIANPLSAVKQCARENMG